MNIPNNLSGLNVIAIGAITTIIGTLVVQLREYPKAVIGFLRDRYIFTATIYCYDQFYAVVENWLSVNYPDAYRNVAVNSASIKDEKVTKETLNIVHERNKIVIRYGGKWIVIDKEREKMEFSGQANGGYIDYYKFKGWRANKQVMALLKEILITNNETKKEELKILQNDDWAWREVNNLKVKRLPAVVVDEQVKSNLVNDISEFLQADNWYAERGIPYKRTFLFYGPPGNGKTSLALALAYEFNKDVSFLSINNIQNDNGFREILSKIKKGSILLIEDCDKLFVNRDSKEHKISFSTFINCLDGTLYKRGLIAILTTNHIENLDQALLREGRIDVRMEINNPTPELVKQYVQNFYASNHISINETLNIPMAKVQEICVINKSNKEKAVKLINAN